MANRRINILALEASSASPSVALSLDGEVVQVSEPCERTQADHLLELVERLFKDTGVSLHDLTGLACGRGPGSFTGLRVAASVVQGLAYTSNKPVAMISSLAALAASVDLEVVGQKNIDSCAILACIDARKQQLYTGHFRLHQNGAVFAQSDEQVCDPEQVATDEVSVIGVGNGFDEHPQISSHVDQVFSSKAPEAKWVAVLAANGYAKFASAYMATPVYIRDNVTHSQTP